MDKRSMVISVLEDMGYQPRVDSDGDVLFRFLYNYRMGTVWCKMYRVSVFQ